MAVEGDAARRRDRGRRRARARAAAPAWWPRCTPSNAPIVTTLPSLSGARPSTSWTTRVLVTAPLSRSRAVGVRRWRARRRLQPGAAALVDGEEHRRCSSTTANGPGPVDRRTRAHGNTDAVRDRPRPTPRRRSPARAPRIASAGRQRARPRIGLDRVERVRLVDRERPDAQPAQRRRGARGRRARRRDRPRASGCRCRSSTRRAPSPAGYGPGSNASIVEAVDAHRRAARARPPRPPRASSWSRRPPTFSADTIGGTCWRSPTNAARRRVDLGLASPASAAFEHRARGVERVGRDAEHDRRRGTPSSVSCRKRSSRVTRPSPTSSTPVASGSSVPAWPTRFWPKILRSFATTSCDVKPGRLVDDHQPVVHQRHRSSSAAQSAARMRSTVSAIPTSEVKPAAKRWPPPPCASAMWRTSTAPTERRLTFTVPSGSSLRTHATSASRGAAHDVDEPLDLVERHVVARQHVLGHRGPHERLLPHQLGACRAPRPAAAGTRSGAPRTACGSACSTGTSKPTSSPASANTLGVGRLVLEPAGVADRARRRGRPRRRG